MIEGSDIMKRSEERDLPIDSLRLDPDNVRFQHLPQRMKPKDIEIFIWNEPDTAELYKQIIAAKGLYEKPIVNSEFVVKEGNRRIVCLRKIREDIRKGKLPDILLKDFNTVRCTILPKDIKQEDIDLLLASEHVKGKKPWNTFNRAKHIFNLHNIHGFSYDFISRSLGKGKSTVIRAVDVYKATETYGKTYPDDKEWFHKFTYFDELYKKRDLKIFRENQDNVKRFAEWVYNNKFCDVRDVRNLAKIINDNEALEQLERKNFLAAMSIIESKDPTVASPEFKKIKETVDIIRAFSRKQLIETLNDSSRMKMLQTLKQEISGLLKDIESIGKK